MRLNCPTCDAVYEVDDVAIPSSGRRVRCSACDEAWRVSGDGASISSHKSTLAIGVGSAALAMSRSTAIETLAPRRPIPPEGTASETVDATAEAVPETPAAEAKEESFDETTTPKAPESDDSADSATGSVDAETSAGAPEPEAVSGSPDETTGPEADESKGEDATAVPEEDAGQTSAPTPRSKFSPTPKPIEIPDAPKPAPVATGDAEDEDDDEAAGSPMRGVVGFVVGFALVVLVFSPYLFRGQIVSAFPEAEPVVSSYAEGVGRVQDGIRSAYAYVSNEVAYLVGGLESVEEVQPPAAPPPSTQ